MPNKIYKDYAIVCFPQREVFKQSWRASVTIAWREGNQFYSHKLDPQEFFNSSEQAVEKGFRLAEFWIDQRM